MKVRIVVEEVVVDAECPDTVAPGQGCAALVEACAKAALELHAARKPTSDKER